MARIIKGAGGHTSAETMTSVRSRIIDGETFNAKLLARDLVQKAEEEKRVRVSLAQSETEQVEIQSYETALNSVYEDCLNELFRIFRHYEQFYLTGQRETMDLSREIVRKVLGEEFEIPQKAYDSALLNNNLTMKKLVMEMSFNEANELVHVRLPSWLQIQESTKTAPGRICVHTEGFEIECSKEVAMRALRMSNDNA